MIHVYWQLVNSRKNDQLRSLYDARLPNIVHVLRNLRNARLPIATSTNEQIRDYVIYVYQVISNNKTNEHILSAIDTIYVCWMLHNQ